MQIWVDADACPKPIREIIIRASQRKQIPSVFVANHYLSLPRIPYVSSIQVEQGFDVADNAILQRIEEGDILISSDIPLANAVLEKHQSLQVISFSGEHLTQHNIKQRLAMRNLMQSLRDDYALQSGRNAAFSNTQSKQFADNLNRLLDKSKP